MKKNASFEWTFQLFIILICIASLVFSMIEGVSNFDFHHPGLMFSPAIDLKNGLKPFKEVVILYGYLTTYIQSLSLYLFGENLLSIWITTGAFYACSLLIFYRIFLFILPPLFALLTVILIFLIHPYVIYPWSNYYSCTFSLLAILFLISTLSEKSFEKSFEKSSEVVVTESGNLTNASLCSDLSRQDATFSYLAGIAFAMAVLCRYSAIVAIIIPSLAFFVMESCWSKKPLRDQFLKQGLLILLGALTVLLIFGSYCLSTGIWGDFLVQNRVVSQVWQSTFLGALGYHEGSVGIFLLSNLVGNIFSAFKGNLRLSIFSATFVMMIVFVSSYVGLRFFNHHANSKGNSRFLEPNSTDRIAFFISLSSIGAYTNSIHMYESFRLVNGAAIGLVVVMYLAFVRIPEWVKAQYNYQSHRLYMFVILTAFAFLTTGFLHNLLPFNQLQWNSYWDSTRIMQWQGNQIPSKVFAHQLMPPWAEEYYGKIAEVLARFDESYIVVNNTNNTLLNIISDKRKAQILPAEIVPGFWQVIGDLERRKQAIDSGKALIITHNSHDVPEGYDEVLRLRTISTSLDSPSAFTLIAAKRIDP